MEFASPYILLLTPAVLALYMIKSRRKNRALPAPGLAAMDGIPKAGLTWLPGFLLALSCLLLVAAAARPRMPAGEVEEKMPGVDVAVALDVSASMLAEDIAPNRMEAAKEKTKRFAADFADGRMALVVFAGRSFTQCPLTMDSGIIEGLIDQLDVGAVGLHGTAIGDAIINCLNRFKEPATSRVIVLLTDGENNAGTADPLTAARAAKAMGVKIYTIGMGSISGALVPAYGPQGQKYYLRDPSGNYVVSKVDEKALREVADITGGQYFRAIAGDALAEVYKKIAELEKREITVKREKQYAELFGYPAGAALFLMAAGGLLGATRLRVL